MKKKDLQPFFFMKKGPTALFFIKKKDLQPMMLRSLGAVLGYICDYILDCARGKVRV